MKAIKVVNFGYGKRGLSTVGYTLYNSDLTVKQARTTSGVSEVGTTGIYACEMTFDDDWEGLIVWDTGEASPRYATEEYLPQLNTIQRETDKIRIIWNSLKNQAEFFNRLSKLNKIPKLLANLDLDKLNSKLDKLSKNKNITSAELKKALASVKIEYPDIKLPAIPDYSQQLADLKKSIDESKVSSQIKEAFTKIQRELSKIPKEQKDYTKNFALLNKNINALLLARFNKLNTLLNALEKLFLSIDVKLNKLNSALDNINTEFKNVVNPHMMYQQMSTIEKARETLEKIQKQISALSLLGLGRK